MKFFWFFCFFQLRVFSEETIWQQFDDVSGKHKSDIKIVIENDRLTGFIETLLPQNPPVNLAEYKIKPVVGLQLIKDMKKVNDFLYEGGTILDPKSGDLYSCTIQFNENKTELKLRGFLYFSIMGRTQIWKKKN